MSLVSTCPRCGRTLDAAAEVCPTCRAVVGRADDVTRLASAWPEEEPPSREEARTPSPSSSSGWLSSSGAIDHGRFAPGTLLGGRYRIVGRLGKGGMGDVYRADDLKLGQPVALKFLPEDVDRDPARLTQLHTEVRMARQVSHSNVCRVYDIDEIDGHTFLSMEYVDGEDLGSILRRFGRFSQERALAIARQICAGLAAAHERGVVHRDFKPANVMLDGAGRVRITDFGLAGVGGESLRAGTPAYMAPEQLAGQEVTVRSDIYALGLVLYEVFTGERAIDAKNLAELIRRRELSEFVWPSEHVRDLDPGIETAILGCLSPAPGDRPASALAVAAALPGGDPLAAALAAGETPSPEMVAAAGGSAGISRRTEIAAGAWIVLSLLLLMVVYDRVMLVNRIAMPKTPAALQDRAAEALEKLGYPGPHGDEAWGVTFSLDYARHIEQTSTAPDRWDRLATARPEALILWYRTSPVPLIPYGPTQPLTSGNPPLVTSGMTITAVDGSGRLGEFRAVAPPIEDGATPADVDWGILFELAGLPMDAFTPVPPRAVPPEYATERRAWEGRLPEVPDLPFRVEAAALGGKPVYFAVLGPWSVSAREAAPRARSGFAAFNAAIEALVMPALMLAGVLLARRNLALERGDRRGALRAASAMFLIVMFAWFVRAHPTPLDVEINRMFAAIGSALFSAAVLWVTYLGLEPYVRKYSPESMIGWTRLIAGRWRDPRVGYDVMIGVSAGLAMTVLYGIHNLIPPLLGYAEPRPLTMRHPPDLLLGTREVLGYLAERIADGIQGGMLCVVGVVALQLLLRRAWLAALAAIVLFTPVALSGMFPDGTPVLDIVIGVGIVGVLVATIVRVGLLATTAAIATHFVLLRAPITTDLSAWHAPTGLWFVAFVAAVGLGACYVARHGATGDSVRAARFAARVGAQ